MTDNISINSTINTVNVTQDVNTVSISSPGPQGPVGLADPSSSVAYATYSASSIFASSALYAINSSSAFISSSALYATISASSNISSSAILSSSAVISSSANISSSAIHSSSANISSSAVIAASSLFSSSVINGLVQTSSVVNSYIKLSTTQPADSGTIYYDSTLGALSLVDGTTSPQHLGQQIFIQVVNDSSSVLPKGTAVYLNGVQGNRPVVSPGIASSSAAHDIIGLVYDDIAAHQQGLVITQGLLEGIDTRPFTPGAEIYLSPTVAGGLTPTEPVYPNYAYVVAQALNSTPNGNLLVLPYSAYNQVNVAGAIQFSDGYRTIGSANATLDLNGNLRVQSASISGSAVATQAYVTSQGYVTYAGSVAYSSSTGYVNASNVSGSVTSALNSASLAGQPGSYYYPASNITSASVAYATNSGNSTTTSQTNFSSLTISGSPVATQAYVTSQGYVTSSGSVAYATNASSANYAINSGSANYANNAGNSLTTSQTAFSSLSTTNALTVGGDVNIGGSLYVSGSTVSISASNLVLNDPLLYLADGNPANINDIGIVGSFTPGASNTYQHTGLVRDATDNTWKLFSGVIPEPTTTVDFSSATWDPILLGNITASPTSGVAITARPSSSAVNNQEWQNTSGTLAAWINSGGSIVSNLGSISGVQGVRAGTQLNLGTLSVIATSSATIGSVIRGATSQSSDLTQWQNNSGTILGAVNASGQLVVGSATPIVSTSAAMVSIYNSSSNNSGLIIRNAANQSLDPFILQNSTASQVFGVSDAGKIKIGLNAGFGSPLSMLSIQTNSTGAAGAIIRATSGQTADLQQWQNSAGTILSVINASGQLAIGGSAALYGLDVYQGSIRVWNGITGAGQSGTIYLGDGSFTKAYGSQWTFSGGLTVSGGPNTFSNGQIISISTASTIIPIIARANSTQSANLQEWQNNSGTILSTVNASGQIIVGSATPIVSTSAAMVSIYNSSSNTPALILRSASLQSSNMLEIYDNSTTRKDFVVGPAGRVQIRSNATDYGSALSIGTNNTAVTGVSIRGQSNQTANLQEWQNSAGAISSSINAYGAFSTASSINSPSIIGTLYGLSSSATISSSALISNDSASLGGIISSSYALQSYVNTTSANVFSQAQTYANSGSLNAYSQAVTYANSASLNAYSQASAFTQTSSAGLYGFIVSASQGIITAGSVQWSTSAGNSTISSSAIISSSALYSSSLVGPHYGTGANITAGTIPPTALSASQVIIGTSSVSLGLQSTTIAGLTSISAASFTGNGAAITGVTGLYNGTTLVAEATTGNEFTLHRVNSSSEGGQINFNRATDDTAYWNIDVYGNTASPTMRWIDATPTVRMSLDSVNGLNVTGNIVYNQATNAQIGNYTLALSDSGKFLEINSTARTIVTIPASANVNFAIGARIDIIQTGAGIVTASQATGTMTFNYYSPTTSASCQTKSQWAALTLIKRAADTWLAIGNIA